ncbi:cation:dicarboxylate symporter family transporter [Streptomyces sp. HUAS TT7]|uniref:cation:dicarboxylate symporter family transporter n=1 Tax=Streptomyces sp. HUAS TT7 TaxID=3447507 RepID=UPI003F660C0F
MAAIASPAPFLATPPAKPWYKQLYFWVLTAIVCGILTGWLWPSVGVALEPVGTTFVSAIKMLITPIVFLTIVAGIGGGDSLRRVGRVGLKSLLYSLSPAAAAPPTASPTSPPPSSLKPGPPADTCDGPGFTDSRTNRTLQSIRHPRLTGPWFTALVHLNPNEQPRCPLPAPRRCHQPGTHD